MDDRQTRRFDSLQGRCVDREFIEESYAIRWPPDSFFEADFGDWMKWDRPGPCDPGLVARWAFEGFLQTRRLYARNYAAAKLGMTEASLDRLVPELPRLGLRKTYEVYPGVIDESLGEDLTRTLSGLRFTTFGTHDSFCEILHDRLRAGLGIEVAPLFCATADRLGEARTFAATWDSITLEPLSLRHQIWLDFAKPISLSPDRCSKLLYAANHELLRPFMFGGEELRDLNAYLAKREASR